MLLLSSGVSQRKEEEGHHAREGGRFSAFLLGAVLYCCERDFFFLSMETRVRTSCIHMYAHEYVSSLHTKIKENIQKKMSAIDGT